MASQQYALQCYVFIQQVLSKNMEQLYFKHAALIDKWTKCWHEKILCVWEFVPTHIDTHTHTPWNSQ